jgi:hypothetical protein
MTVARELAPSVAYTWVSGEVRERPNRIHC